MRAPEILYVDTHQDLSDSFLYAFAKKDNDSDIEYVHKDVFIEKAVNFLEMLVCGFTITDNFTKSLYDNVQLIEDFKKYMDDKL